MHSPDILVGPVVLDQCFLRLQRLGVINFELARARDHGQVVPGQAEPRVLSDHIPPGTDNRVRLSAVSVLTTL